jgi:glycine/D-amino acid oxidase-like deaminating enzyme
MDRRHCLRLLAASALALGPFRTALARHRPARKVVIIGAGIMGAAIGYELAKRGAQVTILEKNAPASGATGDSFAYLNASTKASSRPYFNLNWLGLAGWRAWQQEAGAALPLQWGGSVYWRDEQDAATQLLSTLKTLQTRGYDAERIEADDIRRLAPALKVDAFEAGAFYEEEGAVDPAGAVTALLGRAKQHGATVVYPTEVTGLLATKGRVRGVRTRDGEVAADTVVVAAGFDSQALAQTLDVRLPLTSSKGILLHTKPQPRLLDRVVFAPGSTIRQSLDGRIISSNGHEGSDVNLDPAEIGQQILASASRYLPQIKNAEIERVSIGRRVIPVDTFPIVGFAPKVEQLYFSVTHSGITLAPILARIAATEILEGVAVELLDGFRPERFVA